MATGMPLDIETRTMDLTIVVVRGCRGWDAAFAEFGQHGGVVDAEVFADPGEGPAEVVEVERVELPGTTWFRPVSGRGRIGEFPEQRLQGFYLGFCVAVSSP
ncbi:hypothetical protein SD37_33290 [Amycolatopsis orientalis]|uniref:Uncharacterized protein n=1 Tax=Amycolatopsis orientalis TaxID=31958 RepID=A0A193C6P5_AMYOR|nr:hypothetical protein SD37_33290 [Amycolatopsis orientalis]